MDDIYNSKILEFAGNISRAGTLPDAEATSEKHSKLCGSRVRVYIKTEDGKVSDLGPSGRFEDMRYLKPVKDYKARHASTMLTFEAVVDCLDQIEAKDAAVSA